MTGVSMNTVLKFIPEFGTACRRFHNERVRNLDAVERVQADEVWTFSSSKDKNIPADRMDDENYGSVWTWAAICADTKLMVTWRVGGRDAECAARFMRDLASRLSNRVQLTTDGHGVYERAVEGAFGWDIDYAQLIKVYGEPRPEDSRYSPCDCVGAERKGIIGRPLHEDISTSYVERSNLTLRMGNRRFTRLTNAFSRKVTNLRASVSIHYTFYNWCRVHKSLRITPAMAAGITDHVWELEELVALLEAQERAVVGTEKNKRGPYRKQKTA